MADQDYEDNEGMKNLRDHAKELEKGIKERDARLAEIEEERATERASAREADVRVAFREAGLAEQSASLYPSDLAVSADSVADWASNHGINPVAPSLPRDETMIDRYNRFIAGSGETVGTEDDRSARLMRRVVEARTRKFRPSSEERQELEKDEAEVNALNRQLEREILAGRAQPFGQGNVLGYGGGIDPPIWANRTLEATR